LESTAAALAFGNDDPAVVFDQDTNGREVDLSKRGLHQATREESDTRPGGTMSLHEFIGISGSALEDGRATGKKKAMHSGTHATQQACGQHGQIENQRSLHCGGGKPQL
jgi:hypothetical protein